MNYKDKILYQSNYWYNDGLRKAQNPGSVRSHSFSSEKSSVQPGKYRSEKSAGVGLLRTGRDRRGVGGMDHQQESESP